MMVKASKVAIVIAVVALTAIATMAESSAAPVTAGAKAVITPVATKVVYRGYLYDDYGLYTYRPVYTYRGYTVWYPGYAGYAYPGAYYYGGW